MVLRDSTSGPFEENPPCDVEGEHLKRPFEANYSGVTVAVVAPCGVVVAVTVVAPRGVAVVVVVVVLRAKRKLVEKRKKNAYKQRISRRKELQAQRRGACSREGQGNAVRTAARGTATCACGDEGPATWFVQRARSTAMRHMRVQGHGKVWACQCQHVLSSPHVVAVVAVGCGASCGRIRWQGR
jgi:hypothetical protein